MLKERSKQIKVNHECYGILLSELLHNPSTRRELMDLTGLSRGSVDGLINALRKHKVIHISSWDKDARGCESIAVYAFGEGIDAKRKIKDRKTISRDYKARKKMKNIMAGFCAANGDAYEVAA